MWRGRTSASTCLTPAPLRPDAEGMSKVSVTGPRSNVIGQDFYQTTVSPQGDKVGLDVSAGSLPLAVRIDEASSTVTYVGKAKPGGAVALAVWQIMKIDETSGLVITWADGDALFDNIWNDRAGLVYS